MKTAKLRLKTEANNMRLSLFEENGSRHVLVSGERLPDTDVEFTEIIKDSRVQLLQLTRFSDILKNTVHHKYFFNGGSIELGNTVLWDETKA